jgi:hypothetical protein
MPFYAGQQGKLFIDDSTQPAAKVVSWSFSSTVNVLDTTVLSDTDRTLIYGIRSMSGSCRLYYYNYDGGGSVKNDCGLLLSKVIKSGSTAGDGQNDPPEPVKLKLKVEDGSADGRWLTLPALITSVSMSMNVGEVLAADIAFEVNGAPLSHSNLSSGITNAPLV